MGKGSRFWAGRRALAGACVALLAAVVIASASAGGALTPATFTGSISVTCSLGQCGNFYGWTCDRPVALDSLTVNLDVPGGLKSKARDAVYLGPGCTGTIGTISVVTTGGDGIKVAEGAHDLTIGSGTVSCTSSFADVHQDGVQVMGGSHITFTNLVVACTSANSDQFRVVMAGSSTVPPDSIVCEACEFHPGPTAYHDVTIGASTNSGVADSLVCPSVSPNLVFNAGGATSPVNRNNRFPSAC